MYRKSYDVFISYRRNGGQDTAKMIRDALTEKGYKVFFDVESLRSGDFNTELYSVIEGCQDFILICNEGGLDRCQNDDDWVRLEIECAVRNNKNIVPVLLRNFAFPESLPNAIDPIRYKSGIEANTAFFDAFIAKLKEFCISKPPLWRRIVQSVVFQKTLPFLIALLIIVAAGLGVFGVFRHMQNTFPRTTVEKSITDSVFVNMEQNLAVCNNIVENVQKTYTYAERYLQTGSDQAFTDYMFYYGFAKNYLTGIDYTSLKASDALLNKLDGCVLDGSTIALMPDVIQSDAEQITGDLNLLFALLKADNPLPVEQKQACLSFMSKMLDCFSDHIKYGVNEILLPVNESYLHSFIEACNTDYLALQYVDYVWIFDANQLESKIEANYNMQTNLTTDLAAIVGDSNKTLQEAKSQQTAAEEQTETAITGSSDVSDSLSEKASELEQLNTKIDAKTQEAMQKFAPSDDLDDETLWGYMGRNLSLGFFDQAVECLELFGKRDTVNGSVYVPILTKYIRYVESGHEPYGVAVLGYNPDGPAHPFYRIGDIILSVDGNKVMDTDNLSSDNPDAVIKVLRYEPSGGFKEVSFVKSDYSPEPFIAARILS